MTIDTKALRRIVDGHNERLASGADHTKWFLSLRQQAMMRGLTLTDFHAMDLAVSPRYCLSAAMPDVTAPSTEVWKGNTLAEAGEVIDQFLTIPEGTPLKMRRNPAPYLWKPKAE